MKKSDLCKAQRMAIINPKWSSVKEKMPPKNKYVKWLSRNGSILWAQQDTVCINTKRFLGEKGSEWEIMYWKRFQKYKAMRNNHETKIY